MLETWSSESMYIGHKAVTFVIALSFDMFIGRKGIFPVYFYIDSDVSFKSVYIIYTIH